MSIDGYVIPFLMMMRFKSMIKILCLTVLINLLMTLLYYYQNKWKDYNWMHFKQKKIQKKNYDDNKFINNIRLKCQEKKHYTNHHTNSAFLLGHHNQRRVDCNAVNAIIFVISKYNHFQKRNLIRTTWAQHEQSHFPIATVFVVGLTKSTGDNTQREKLNNESIKYGDIIEIGVLDTYRNIVYKHLSALKWITEHCSRVGHVVKVDDDVFVNIVRLRKLLQHTLSHSKSAAYIYGSRKLNEAVPRNLHNKWYTTRAEYSGEYFPTHVKGFAYITTGETVAQLLHCSEYQAAGSVYWVDDVYVTGILAHKLNISIINFYPHYDSLDDTRIITQSLSAIDRTLFVLTQWNNNTQHLWIQLWNHLMKSQSFQTTAIHK